MEGRLEGWKLTDPWSYRYLEKCQELGIRNIHVHKGPTIYPLNRDAFDVADVDDVASAFPELRLTFRRKAYLASLDRLCSELPAPDVTLAEVSPSPRLDAMLRRRAVLGLDCSPGSSLLLDEHGAPLTRPRLRYARSVRLSIEGNAGFCRGLLRTRYLNRSP